MTEVSQGIDEMDDTGGSQAPVIEAVQGFLDNGSRLGRYDLSRYVNRVIQKEGAEIIEDHRRSEQLVSFWESEASAPTGAHPEAKEMAEELRSDMDEEYDSGRVGVAQAVRLAQKSGKVLLEPMTCKIVVDFDHDGAMSRWMDVDVPEMFGVNPDHDPAAAGRLQDMAANRGVDFSRGVESSAEQVARTEPATKQSQKQRGVSTKEPTPLRAALLEEMSKLKAEQGFTPNDDRELG